MGNQYAPGVGPNCTTLGGSFYTDFTTWNPPPESPIPSNLVYAIYFVPTSEPPQIGSLGNSLNTLVQSESPVSLNAGAAQPTTTVVVQKIVVSVLG